MNTFFSPYRKYVARDNEGTIAEFENNYFKTPDDALAGRLRKHPMFGNKIHERGAPAPKGNIIQGVRSAGEQPIFDAKEKYIRLGELRNKLLKKDGSFRKDADQKEVEELQELTQMEN